MFNIEKKNYGFKLTLEGFIKKDEITQWVEASKEILLLAPSKFGVFIDMRKLNPLSKNAELELEIGQKLYKQKGLIRSVVILDNPVTEMQFKNIAKETGIYQWERYLNASTPNWEYIGIKWIVNGLDPDQ